MRAEYSDDSIPVKYYIPIGDNELFLNELLGKIIRIEYHEKINCIHCGNSTGKSFAQGYCYPCFISLPQTDACILHPEKCEAHKGISRDMTWSEKNCLSPHIVYLALSPGLKVGVTRESQVPTRWIDQGAWEAIKLARTINRYNAGQIEVFLKNHLADKTNWRHMLTGLRNEGISLAEEKSKIAGLLSAEMQEMLIDDNSITRINYPVNSFPVKVKSLNLDKTPLIQGELTGIKGQYLIFSTGEVLNIRKFGGYYTSLTF